MKIGILTYHRAFNYGAFLQAYALKSFLADMGHDVSFVDYWPSYHEDAYKIWEGKNSDKPFLRNLLVAMKRQVRANAFKKMQYKYLGLPKKPLARSSEELERLEFDVVIYGSDQIWWKSRVGLNGFDDVYWGCHMSDASKKVAYAASMGVIDLTENDKQLISDCLNNFSCVSVREAQLKNVIQPLTSKEIPLVLDPTLLVGHSFWQSVCKGVTPAKGKYILYYKMMNYDKADAFAEEMRRKTSLPVIMVSGRIDSYKVNGSDASTDPIKFVSLIRDAEYVISTSFHGVAMSIQFKKEFFAMGMKNNSDRVSSLLAGLGIEDRMTEIVPTEDSLKINYEMVYSKLDQLREYSKDYLIQSIQK